MDDDKQMDCGIEWNPDDWHDVSRRTAEGTTAHLIHDRWRIPTPEDFHCLLRKDPEALDLNKKYWVKADPKNPLTCFNPRTGQVEPCDTESLHNLKLVRDKRE
jgi:hypothetical protein